MCEYMKGIATFPAHVSHRLRPGVGGVRPHRGHKPFARCSAVRVWTEPFNASIPSPGPLHAVRCCRVGRHVRGMTSRSIRVWVKPPKCRPALSA